MSRARTGIGPLTQWTFIATGAILTFALSPAAPAAWHDTPSLQWLHLVIDYWVFSVLFGAYTLLHLSGRQVATQVGCYLGLGLYMLGVIALVVTLRFDRPTNPLLICAAVLAAVLHFAAGRNATIHGALR